MSLILSTWRHFLSLNIFDTLNSPYTQRARNWPPKATILAGLYNITSLTWKLENLFSETHHGAAMVEADELLELLLKVSKFKKKKLRPSLSFKK